MESAEFVFASTSDSDIEFLRYENGTVTGANFNKDYFVVSHQDGYQFDLLNETGLELGVDVEVYSVGNKQTIYKRLKDLSHKVVKIRDASPAALAYNNSVVDNFTTETGYWTDHRAMIGISTTDFWVGRNEILDLYSLAGFPYHNDYSITDINGYYEFLFAIYKGSKYGTFVLPFANDWVGYLNWTTTHFPTFTMKQKAELWCTYHLRTPTTFHVTDPVFTFLTDTYFTAGGNVYIMNLVQWIGLKNIPWYVINFIQFADILGPNVAGTAWSLDNIFNTSDPDNGAYGFLTLACSGGLYQTSPDKYYNPRDYYTSGGTYYTAGTYYETHHNLYNAADYTWYAISENYRRGMSMINTLVHEIGHCIDFYYSELPHAAKYGYTKTAYSHTEEWCLIMGASWSSADSWVGSKPSLNGFTTYPTNIFGAYEYPVTGYGCTNLYESFAEAFVMYIINPTYLRTTFPKQYTAINRLLTEYWYPIDGNYNQAKIFYDVQP